MNNGGSYLRRLVGAVLLLLVIFPVYRILSEPDAGPFLRGAIDLAELSRSLLIFGSLIVIGAGVILSRVVDSASVERRFNSIGRWLESVPQMKFALILALLSACITLAFAVFVLEGKPNLIDAMAQLLHARYFAAGHLSAPVDRFQEFWQIQNSLVTPHGWVSQYPPGYIVFLALGLKLGAVQIVGPVFAGLTVFFTALAADQILRDDRVIARLGVTMLALSPFLIGLAGAYMNHIGAAAFFAAAMFFAAKSLDERRAPWAILTGLATGMTFSIRPLTAVIAALVVAFIWLGRPDDADKNWRAGFVRRTLWAVVGIAPVFILLGLYNSYFFGSPFRFGYIAAQGPLTGLGFHADPTGQFYGPVQAVGFTSADLTMLSLYLFESPLPAVLIVGLYLMIARRLSWGERVISLWALFPVLGNFFYWHHGAFMGPRMLNEAAPGWALLTAVAAIGLVRQIPASRTLGNYPPRLALAFTLLIGWLGGIFFLGPQRLVSYGGSWQATSRLTVPSQSRPSLVFVHGAWTGREAMRLVAHGLRLDSLEVAMRYNPTCNVHFFALWYAGDSAMRSRTPPPLDFNFARRTEVPKISIANGDDIRAEPRVPMAPECLRQVASDTLGVVEMAGMLWETDLPGTSGPGALVVRDMGPEADAALIARYPGRVPLVFYRPVKEGPPALAPFEVGMRALWPRG